MHAAALLASCQATHACLPAVVCRERRSEAIPLPAWLVPAGAILITHFTLLLGMAAPVWLSNALSAGSSNGSAAAGAAEPGQQQQPLWLAAYAGIMILGAAALVVLAAAACSVIVVPGRQLQAAANFLNPSPCPPFAGFGDTAASAVGSLFGRHRLCKDSSKTWEGTAAAVVATLAAWAALASLGTAALGHAAAGAAGLAQLQQLGVWVRLGGATVLSCLLEGVTTQLDNVFMPLHYFALLLCL